MDKASERKRVKAQAEGRRSRAGHGGGATVPGDEASVSLEQITRDAVEDRGLDLVRLIQQGVPLRVIDDAVEQGAITRDELFEVVIRPRTLSHRKEKGERLTADESDKLVRLLRIKALALETFQNAEKAERWLNKPNRVLGGEAPIQLILTESGARLVEKELHNISWGIFV